MSERTVWKFVLGTVFTLLVITRVCLWDVVCFPLKFLIEVGFLLLMGALGSCIFDYMIKNCDCPLLNSIFLLEAPLVIATVFLITPTIVGMSTEAIKAASLIDAVCAYIGGLIVVLISTAIFLRPLLMPGSESKLMPSFLAAASCLLAILSLLDFLFGGLRYFLPPFITDMEGVFELYTVVTACTTAVASWYTAHALRKTELDREDTAICGLSATSQDCQ